jgi:hypothetical protein
MKTDQKDPIPEILEECFVYWLLRKVPRTSAEGMRDELEQHLREAVADGKTVGDVVGTDLRAFAESWARELRQPSPILYRLFGVGSTFLFSLFILTAMRHLLDWRANFPLTWTMLVSAALLTGLIYFCLRSALAFMSPRRPWKSWHYWLVILGFGGLIGFEVFVRLMQFDQQQAFFIWHWPMTLALALVSVILIFIRSKNDLTRQISQGTSNK